MTTTNTYGRQVVLPLTNKSGGGVIAGDVVVIDTTNNDAFTTSTAGAFTGGVGIAQETIASNAIGRVLLSGYAALVNVNASVTRGNFGKTYTVAKQATDAGASRVTGTFCQFLTGGTTPDAMVHGTPDLGGATGNVATDTIWDAAGDLAVGTGADTAAKLTKGAAGTVPTAGASTLAYAFPPGYELDYVEKTSNTNITSTTSGTPDTIVTSSSVTYDGTAVIVEFFAPGVQAQTSATSDLTIQLRDDTAGTILGYFGYLVSQAANSNYRPVLLRRRLTPAAGARVYSVRAFLGGAGTGTVLGGAGGSATTALPAYIRIVKV